MDAFGLPPNKALRTDGAFQNGGSSAGVPPELQALLQSLPPEAQAAAVAAAQALGIPAPADAAPGSDPVMALPAMPMSSPFPSVPGQAPTPRVIPPPQRMMQMGSNTPEASLLPPGLMGLVPGAPRPAAEATWNPAAQGKGAGAWGGKGGWMPPGTQGLQLRAPSSGVPPRVIPARSDVLPSVWNGDCVFSRSYNHCVTAPVQKLSLPEDVFAGTGAAAITALSENCLLATAVP
eukprot:s5726_g3.t1